MELKLVYEKNRLAIWQKLDAAKKKGTLDTLPRAEEEYTFAKKRASQGKYEAALHCLEMVELALSPRVIEKARKITILPTKRLSEIPSTF